MTTDTILTGCLVAAMLFLVFGSPLIFYLMYKDAHTMRATTLDEASLRRVADDLARLSRTVRALIPEEEASPDRDRARAGA